MTDPTRPGGDTADSDTADSEVARDVLAAHLWEHCHVPDDATLIYDDPRNIAAHALTWMRKHTALPTHVRWAEAVGVDKAAVGKEVTIPVRDEGGSWSQIDLSYENAGVLGAMLTDAADQGGPVDMTPLDEMLNEYSRIAEKAFAASRLTDAAGDPIYSDYQDWYRNGDWHADSGEDETR